MAKKKASQPRRSSVFSRTASSTWLTVALAAKRATRPARARRSDEDSTWFERLLQKLGLGEEPDLRELIEDALTDAHAGEWEGAGISRSEVNFGFAVDDFDTAEEIVRKAVTGTRFEHFREIVRNEFDMIALA